jgi:hypothetical protein
MITPSQQQQTGFSRLLSEGLFVEEGARAASTLRRAAGVWAASWLTPVCPTLGGSRAVCDGGAMAWIELEGAANVRDLGDLPTEDGQKTARARLLRADNLQDLSAADVGTLVRASAGSRPG